MNNDDDDDDDNDNATTMTITTTTTTTKTKTKTKTKKTKTTKSTNEDNDEAEEECDETKMILARHSPDQRRTTLLFRWHRRQHLDSLVHHTQFVSDGSSVFK
ncbi:hypothetical protein HZH68_008881 [Vespula germanica]|uniref:Uncharacterized protein n=1 Tax=Vespula germanica TaxID=30212 RepID=A0A834JZM9_VESGE|nr:hypothetical protein HZH68_008881 [Vespula germanica]